jgi:hypothetical protein
MAVLGINGTTGGLWLAVVGDDRQVADSPPQLNPASNAPLDKQIPIAVADAKRLFDRLGIFTVVILDAETGGRNSPSYTQLVPRISMEAAVMYAAHEHGIPAVRVTRARVRSALDLPKSGKLSDLAATVLEPHPPHWVGKRDLAALAALAVLRS